MLAVMALCSLCSFQSNTIFAVANMASSHTIHLHIHAFVLRSSYGEGDDYMPKLPCSLPPKKQCQYPNPMLEIGMAMLVIRKHAEDWLVDMERIAVCGFSAGAHNAAMYGVYWNDAMMSNALYTSNQELRPAALILGYALTDYVLMESFNKTEFAQSFYNATEEAYLGCAAPDRNLLIRVSPTYLVNGDVLPTFLWATSEDNMVPVLNRINMAHSLAENGIPFELHIFERGAHGLSLANQTTALSKAEINYDAAKWTDLADAWLIKRFAFELPDTSGLEEVSTSVLGG